MRIHERSCGKKINRRGRRGAQRKECLEPLRSSASSAVISPLLRSRTAILLALTLCLAATPHLAQDANRQAAQKPQKVVVFVDVNVAPMDTERIIEKQTVIVRDGRIIDISPTGEVKIPDDALRIDGRGKYLMPGLAEMHGHLPPPNATEKEVGAVLTLFLANGVTTVRGMFGFPNHISMRDRVARGELLGPRIYAASPALSGQSVKSPEEAEKLVREHKAAGFDLLKIHEGLSEQAYERIVATANALEIPYAGHVPDSVGIHLALKKKQATIDHLDNYLVALEADDSPIKNADPQTRAKQWPFHMDEKKIPALAKATTELGAWNVPTMTLYMNLFSTESSEALAARPEMKYLNPQMVNNWVQARNNMLKNNDPAAVKRILEFRVKMLKALFDAGAKIMVGSDAPQFFNAPGFSVHREMQAMVDAGMTPFQVLECGTRRVAFYLNKLGYVGTVEEGKWADLLLLEANPLQNISNVSRRAGVMIRGIWLPESELRRMLDEIEAMYKPAK